MKKFGIHPKPFRSRLLIYIPLVLAVYMFLWPGIYRFGLVPLDRYLAGSLGADSALVSSVRSTADLLSIPLAIDPPPWQASTHFVTREYWATFPSWIIAIPFMLICGFATVYFLGSKGFCTYGCPYGGFFAPLDKLAPMRIRVTDACNHCGHCTAVCTSNVRVHEEVREYGMVVNPGCMKCLDCVSVCPNDALYVGLGAPAMLKGAPRNSRPKKHFDLTFPEELACLAVFAITFYSLRGVYPHIIDIPLLMAVGIAACFTFIAWKAWRVIRDHNVSFHRLQLKFHGSIRPAGLALVVGTFAFFVFTLHCGAAQLLPLLARRHDMKVHIDPRLVFSPAPMKLPDDMHTAALAADRYYKLASSFHDGGLALATSPDVLRRRRNLAAMLHDFDASQVLASRMITDYHPAPHDIRFFIDLMFNQERFEETFSTLDALVHRLPDDPFIIDFVAEFSASADRLDHAIAYCKLGLEHAPDNLLIMRRLSLLELNANNYDESIRLIRRTLEIDPDNPAAYYFLAQAYKMKADPQSAIAALQEAIRISPQAFIAREDLASLLEYAGRSDDAAYHAQLAAEHRAAAEARAHQQHDHSHE